MNFSIRVSTLDDYDDFSSIKVRIFRIFVQLSEGGDIFNSGFVAVFDIMFFFLLFRFSKFKKRQVMQDFQSNFFLLEILGISDQIIRFYVQFNFELSYKL